MSDGGAERAVSNFSDALCNLGYKVGLFIYIKTDNEYALNPKVKVYRFKEGSSNKLKIVLERHRQIKNTIMDFKPDICVPFLPGVIEDTFFAAGRTPVVATVRCIYPDLPKRTQKAWEFVYSRCVGVFFQTQAQTEYFSENVRRRGFVVPNSVPDEFFEFPENSRQDIKRFVSVGRLNAQKNYPMLIDAFVKAHTFHPEISLDIYGDGEEQNALNDRIRKAAAESFICLKGKTDNISETLGLYDGFLFTSNYEGMPNALMEAMAVGLPCISTDCPTGPKDLIGSNERGVLVPMNDAEQFCEAVVNMIEHPEKAKNTAKSAKMYMRQHFTKEAVAKRLATELDKRI